MLIYLILYETLKYFQACFIFLVFHLLCLFCNAAQSVVDRAINDICILLGCSRHNLNVVGSPLGFRIYFFLPIFSYAHNGNNHFFPGGVNQR